MTLRNSVELWDAYYRQNRYVAWWPNESMIRFVVNERLRAGSNRPALDLGCGNGRHLWLLARERFDTTGVDVSPVATSMARKWMKREGMAVKVARGEASALPFHDAVFHLGLASDFFDYMPMREAIAAVRELHRVMAPGAPLCATLRSTRDKEFGVGRKVARNTFVLPAWELGMIVHYFDGRDLEELFAMFRNLQVECVDRSVGEHLSYVWSYWVVTGIK